MSLFGDIEKRIDGQLRKMFASESAAAQGRELIEIQRAILDELEDRAQLLPRARRRFPYNDLTVRIAAPAPDRRSAIDLVFIEGDALQNEIATYLRGEDIEVPSDLRVRVESLEDPPAEITARGYHITYNTRELPSPKRSRTSQYASQSFTARLSELRTKWRKTESTSDAYPRCSMSAAAPFAATMLPS